MAEISPPNLVNLGIFGTIRKDWFRCLLVWMLFLSNIFLLIWAYGWCYVKTQLGWVRLGPYGARPWPSALFPEDYKRLNGPLTILFSISYSLLASLNAHEGLFWTHLMRATRKPHLAKPFLQSHYFLTWLAVNVIILVAAQGATWIGFTGDLELQLSRELLVGGVIELLILLASTSVIIRFPSFLNDLETLGAGPEVRTRLYVYHQHNITRTVFRFTLSIPLLCFGVDGLTTAKMINLNPMATDFLTAIVGVSLAMVTMISIVLYLPRLGRSDRTQVQVGPNKGLALVSLLKVGGHWDAETDKAEELQLGTDQAPFASATPRRSSWNTEGQDDWREVESTHHVPRMVSNFSSPIAIGTEAPAKVPLRIQMQVEREVHAD